MKTFNTSLLGFLVSITLSVSATAITTPTVWSFVNFPAACKLFGGTASFNATESMNDVTINFTCTNYPQGDGWVKFHVNSTSGAGAALVSGTDFWGFYVKSLGLFMQPVLTGEGAIIAYLENPTCPTYTGGADYFAANNTFNFAFNHLKNLDTSSQDQVVAGQMKFTSHPTNAAGAMRIVSYFNNYGINSVFGGTYPYLPTWATCPTGTGSCSVEVSYSTPCNGGTAQMSLDGSGDGSGVFMFNEYSYLYIASSNRTLFGFKAEPTQVGLLVGKYIALRYAETEGGSVSSVKQLRLEIASGGVSGSATPYSDPSSTTYASTGTGSGYETLTLESVGNTVGDGVVRGRVTDTNSSTAVSALCVVAPESVIDRTTMFCVGQNPVPGSTTSPWFMVATRAVFDGAGSPDKTYDPGSADGTSANDGFVAITPDATKDAAMGWLKSGGYADSAIVTNIGLTMGGAIAEDSSGNIYLAGSRWNSTTSLGENLVTQTNASGVNQWQYTSAFNDGSVVTAAYKHNAALGMVLDKVSGKPVIAGPKGAYVSKAEYQAGYIARLTTAGCLDTTGTFNGTTGVLTTMKYAKHQQIIAIGQQSSTCTVSVANDCANRFIVCGYGQTESSTGSNTNPDIFCIGVANNGTLDTNFGPTNAGYTTESLGISTSAESLWGMAIQPDDKIVVVGRTSLVAANVPMIARFTKDGALDTSFNSTGMQLNPFGDSVAGVFRQAVVHGGYIYVVGEMTNGTDLDIVVARFAVSNGARDTNFGNNGKWLIDAPDRNGDNTVVDNGQAIAVDQSSDTEYRIVVAGDSDAGSGDTVGWIQAIRINATYPNGIADSRFASSGSQYIDFYNAGTTPTTGHAGIRAMLVSKRDRGILVGGMFGEKTSAVPFRLFIGKLLP